MTNVTTNPNTQQKPHMQVVDLIRQTAPVAIAELDFVKQKFIDNFNLTHKEKNGELMYHRQMVHFKQIISGNDTLKAADPFSLYACFVTAAVNGYSFDPNDDEVYLIPKGGKAWLWPQTKAMVKRLRNSGQIKFADQAKIVYQGDEFEVENGRVKKHVEKFSSEVMIAGYVRLVIDDKGTDKYFIYRKSDWESWRKKSLSPNGENWNSNGQPLAAFLRTKIVKHACDDSSWSSGRTSIAEQFSVEIEHPQEVRTEETASTEVPSDAKEENSFSPPASETHEATVVHESNDDNSGF